MKRNGKGIGLLRRLAVLAVAALLLFTGGPDGAAVHSPAETLPVAEEPHPAQTAAPVLPARAEKDAAPLQTLPDEAAGPGEATAESAPVKMPEVPVEGMELRCLPADEAAGPGEATAESAPGKMPEVPVEGMELRCLPADEAVEDAYFERAAFLGDSRTEGFMLYSGLDVGSYYYAVGATVESVFTKAVETAAGEKPLLDAMAEGDFDRIYVMLGVNELGWKGTDLFYGQYGALIDRLRQDHPAAQIVLQSILPVGAKQEAKGTYVNNGRIGEYNARIRQLAEEKDCWYLELGAAVSDETGLLREDWSYDGVHLNHKGCRAWLAELRSHPVPPAELQ